MIQKRLSSNLWAAILKNALPLFELSNFANFALLPEKEQQEVIVFKVKEREIGLMVTPPIDALEVTPECG